MKNKIEKINKRFLIIHFSGIILGFIIFLFLFFSIQMEKSPIISFLKTGYSLVSLIIIYILPFLIFLPVFYRRDNNKLQKKFRSISNVLIFAIISCCSFIYVISSAVIAHYFSKFGLYSSIFFLLIVPSIFGIYHYKLFLELAKFLISKVLINRSIIFSIELIILITLILRYPYFIPGEIGVDTFVHNTITNLFIKTGRLGFLISPLSIFQWFPDSVIPSGIIYTANISILSGITSYEAVFLVSVFSGLISSICFYLLINSFPMKNILSSRGKKFSIIFYLTLPLLLKYTDWFVSGRTLFFMIIPSVIIVLLNIVFNQKIKFNIKIYFFILIFFTLILSHGLGRIFFLFAIVLYTIAFCVKKIRSKKFIKTNLKFLKFCFLLFGITLFFLPFFLYLGGDKSLIGYWVLSRTELISFNWADLSAMNLLYAFIFIFTARMGIVSIFFIIGILYIPILKIEKVFPVYVIILSLFCFFPFLQNSMYFYQSLSLIFLLIGCVLFDSFLDLMKDLLIKYKSLLNFVKKEKLKLFGFFLVGNMLFTGFIQYYRSIDEGNPIDSDIIDVTNYLRKRTNNSQQISIISSTGILSIKISAYSNIVSFPMGSSTFLCAFPEFHEQIEYYMKDLDITSINSIIKIFRYGIFSSNLNDFLININGIIHNTSFSDNNFIDFLYLFSLFNFKYIICEEAEEWALVDYLVENNYVYEIKTFGYLNIYILLIDLNQSFFSLIYNLNIT